MNDRNGLERHADPGKFEHDPATCAIAESGDAVRVDTGNPEKNIKGGATDSPHPLDVRKQRHGPGQHRVRPAEEQLTTVIIHRQRQIAMRGQIVGPLPLVLVKADPIMSYEHRRPRPLGVGPRQMGDHAQAVYVIGDFTRRNHRRSAEERSQKVRMKAPSSKAADRHEQAESTDDP